MINVKLETPHDLYWNTVTSKLKITVSQGIKDIARLACDRAARATFPSGTTNKTKESLEKSIYKDINNAYNPVPNEKLEDDGGRYLQRHRNSKGRVPQGTKPKFVSFSDYNDITDKLKKRAGMVKAGWLQASKELKSNSRIPVWLRKNIELADVSVKPDSVIVINRVRYASNLITDNQLKNLMENAFRGLIRRAERIKL